MRGPVHTAPQPHLSSWACPWRSTVPKGTQRLHDLCIPQPSSAASLGELVFTRGSLPSLGSHGCHHYDPPFGTWGCRGRGLWVPRPLGLPLSGEDSAPSSCPGLACAEPESGAAPGRGAPS